MRDQKEMSHMKNESDDGLHFKNHSESPSTDGGSGCGSRWEGTVLKKGPWTSAEDAILIEYVKKHGEGNWNAVQKHTGLSRCGKSCRLRWANHLRPNLKKGAFNQEEEQLIIELHAKMGNKWARMAAHLPGRTDNEIKNYWNTRVKRRHRAGLPLYPPEMHMQILQGNQDDDQSRIILGDNRHQDLWKTECYEPNVIFDSLKGITDMLPNASNSPEMSTCNMLVDGASFSHYSGLMPLVTHCQKRLRESRASFPGHSNGIKEAFISDLFHDRSAPQKISKSFEFSFACDSDPSTKNPHSFDAIPGSHTLLNGNFSTSKPTFGAMKSELPSFQYPESNLDRWSTSSYPPTDLLESVDAFIQSPSLTGTMESGSVSPHNSGLLDMLLHEAKIRSSTKNSSHSSQKSMNSDTCDIVGSITLNASETKFNDCNDPFNPLAHSATSVLSECTQAGRGGSSSDGSLSVAEIFTGDIVKSEAVDDSTRTKTMEKDLSTVSDTTRPDVLLASSWLEQGSVLIRDTTTMSESLAALFGQDLENQYIHTSAETLSGQGWGFGSCAWDNMPPVCQMTKLP